MRKVRLQVDAAAEVVEGAGVLACVEVHLGVGVGWGWKALACCVEVHLAGGGGEGEGASGEVAEGIQDHVEVVWHV